MSDWLARGVVADCRRIVLEERKREENRPGPPLTDGRNPKNLSKDNEPAGRRDFPDGQTRKKFYEPTREIARRDEGWKNVTRNLLMGLVGIYAMIFVGKFHDVATFCIRIQTGTIRSWRNFNSELFARYNPSFR